MSDFMAALLVMLALAAVGNFASSPEAFHGQCPGRWVQVCW